MASNAKKKTTMKKLNRENAVRERRMRKEARKNARKQAAAADESGTGEVRIDDAVVEANHEPGPVGPGSPTV
jgi:hypothetical protein